MMISGKTVFDFVDSFGVPLEDLRRVLKEKGMSFDVPDFIKSAHSSVNFQNPDRLYIRLMGDLNPNHPDFHRLDVLIRGCIEKTYGTILK